MNFGQVWDLSSSFYCDNITKPDSKIFSDCFIHSDFSLFQFIIDQGDHKSFFTFLSLDEDGVSFEDFKLRHFSL
jgi:hypothetical protein